MDLLVLVFHKIGVHILSDMNLVVFMEWIMQEHLLLSNHIFLRELIDEKEDKLLQMGKNVFETDTKDPEDVIVKIENMYKSLNVD